jgi:hypothetical protein
MIYNEVPQETKAYFASAFLPAGVIPVTFLDF